MKTKLGENESAYSLLNEELKAIESQLTDLQSEQALFSEKLGEFGEKMNLMRKKKYWLYRKELTILFALLKKAVCPVFRGILNLYTIKLRSKLRMYINA